MSATELFDAIHAGDQQRVSELLDDVTSPEATTDDRTTALYAAGFDPPVIRALVAAGANPNRESRGPTEGLPLCAAACHSEIEGVRALLAVGTDPNLAEDGGSGYTPLAWGIQNDDAETAIAEDLGKGRIVEILTSHGAVARREPDPSA